MLVSESTSPQFGLNWSSLVIRESSGNGIFEQTFSTRNTSFPNHRKYRKYCPFYWMRFSVLIPVCLNLLCNKDINSCYTAGSHATNVFLHLFVCFKTWPSLNLEAVSPHQKTLYFPAGEGSENASRFLWELKQNIIRERNLLPPLTYTQKSHAT